MDKTRDMYRHFSIVASNYRQIRTTDHEPIEFIAESLNGLHDIKAADIGCGGGRYDMLLFKYLANLHLRLASTLMNLCLNRFQTI